MPRRKTKKKPRMARPKRLSTPVRIPKRPRAAALIHDLAPYVEAQYRSIERVLGPALYDDLLRVLDAVVEQLATPAPLVALPATQASRKRPRAAR